MEIDLVRWLEEMSLTRKSSEDIIAEPLDDIKLQIKTPTAEKEKVSATADEIIDELLEEIITKKIKQLCPETKNEVSAEKLSRKTQKVERTRREHKEGDRAYEVREQLRPMLPAGVRRASSSRNQGARANPWGNLAQTWGRNETYRKRKRLSYNEVPAHHIKRSRSEVNSQLSRRETKRRSVFDRLGYCFCATKRRICCW